MAFDPDAIRGVVFDKDGTLLDFEKTWGPATTIVIEELSGGDPAIRDALAAAVGFDQAEVRFDPSSPLIAGAADDFGPDWARILGREAGRAHFSDIDARYRLAATTTLTPIGDPLAMAEALAGRGLVLGIATNDAEANARDHAGRFGIDSLFSFVAGWDSGFGSKPDPGQLLAFADHVGAPAGTIAMVGDSAHDMSAARAAGMRAVAVRTGPGAVEAAALADVTVDTIDDLPALFSSAGK